MIILGLFIHFTKIKIICNWDAEYTLEGNKGGVTIMSLTKFIRDVQKIHEAIPTPGAIFYNATAAKIFRKPESLLLGSFREIENILLCQVFLLIHLTRIFYTI